MRIHAVRPPSGWQVVLTILVLVLSTVLGELNFDKPLKPKDPLEIRLEYSFVTAWPRFNCVRYSEDLN